MAHPGTNEKVGWMQTKGLGRRLVGQGGGGREGGTEGQEGPGEAVKSLPG